MRSSLSLSVVALGLGCALDRSGLAAPEGQPDATPPDTSVGVEAGPVDADGDSPTDAGPPPCLESPILLFTFEEGFVEGKLQDEATDPPDLTLVAGGADPGAIAFGDGAVILTGGRLEAIDDQSAELGEHLSAAGSFALEVWASADAAAQPGLDPHRIVTLSAGTSDRAFTVGQTDLGEVAYRLRTSVTDTSGNSFNPPLSGTATRTSPVVFPRVDPVQIVAHYDGTRGAQELFVDGVSVAAISHPDRGAVATLRWDHAANTFGLGDEFGTAGRAWSGRIHRVAIWSRALLAGEVSCLFDRGADAPLVPPR